MKKSLAMFLALMLLLLMVGCTPADGGTPGKSAAPSGGESLSDANDAIYVAMHVPLTGDASQYGEYISNGFMVAIDECNANGGINGRKIIVDIFDDKSESAEASTIATKIAEDEKYICAVGSYNSTCSLAVAPIYEENKVVHFCPTAGSGALQDYAYTFPMAMGEAVEYDLFSKLAVDLAGGGEIGYVHLNSDNGIESKNVMLKSVPAYGGTMALNDSYNEGDVRDFTALLTKVKEADLDLICFNSTYAEQASALIQARQMGIETPFLFSAPANCKEFIDAAGKDAEGSYAVASFSYLDTREGVQHFVEGFGKRTGNYQPTSFAEQPYEQACMLIKALEEGATDRISLYDTIRSWKTWDGPTVTADFRENGSLARNSLALLVVKDGAWSFAE